MLAVVGRDANNGTNQLCSFGGVVGRIRNEDKCDLLNRLALFGERVALDGGVTGQQPSARADLCCAGDADNNVMYVFGGSDKNVLPCGDLYAFNFRTAHWTLLQSSQQTAAAGVNPRSGATMCFHQNRLYVIGGAIWNPRTHTWNTHNISVSVFDLATLKWTIVPLPAELSLETMLFPSVCVVRNHLLIACSATARASLLLVLFDTVTHSIHRVAGHGDLDDGSCIALKAIVIRHLCVLELHDDKWTVIDLVCARVRSPVDFSFVNFFFSYISSTGMASKVVKIRILAPRTLRAFEKSLRAVL
jgi:hypothetical protein